MNEFDRPNRFFDYQKVTATRLQFSLAAVIDRKQIACAIEPSVVVEPFMDNLVARVNMFLLGNKVHSQVVSSEEVPVGFADYLLLALPKKLQWRCPATRTIKTEISYTHVCPHIRVPDNKAHVDFITTKELL